jgi:L-cysteine S-thiosulfotransferase
MSRAAFAILLGFCASSTLAQPTSRDVTEAMKRDFHPRGQATMARIPQDGVQRICTETRDNPPAALARQLEADQMKTIVFPSGSLMGDWKRAERVAQSGRGSMWNDQPGVDVGGSCYNCHQISPQETSYGTIGPSLLGFGKKRGNNAETQKYVYGKIYNAKAYNACSQMPRLGYAGTLSEEQIKDLVALLLDPASPVNQ